jgi:hypothetical protein
MINVLGNAAWCLVEFAAVAILPFLLGMYAERTRKKKAKA